VELSTLDGGDGAGAARDAQPEGGVAMAKLTTIEDVRRRLREGYSGKTAASKMRGMACDIMFLLRELDKPACEHAEQKERACAATDRDAAATREARK
jgi:hypothetical protein